MWQVKKKHVGLYGQLRNSVIEHPAAVSVPGFNVPPMFEVPYVLSVTEQKKKGRACQMENLWIYVLQGYNSFSG